MTRWAKQSVISAGTIKIALQCHSYLTDGGCEMQGDNPINWLM